MPATHERVGDARRPAPVVAGQAIELEQHRELLLLVDGLRAVSAAPTSALGTRGWRRLLEHDLAQLRSRLEQHFALEERGGYLAGLAERYPRMTGLIGVLAAQHNQIRAALDDIKQRVESGEDVDCIKRQLASTLAVLESHERAETELMQSAVLDDTGTGD